MGQYELIKAEARRLWEKAGFPTGMDIHFWLKAEEVVMNGEKWRHFPIKGDTGRLWSDLNPTEQAEIKAVIGGSTLFPTLLVDQCRWVKTEG